MKTRKMILALALVITILTTLAVPAFALSGGDTITFPLRTENAFANAPIWKGPTTQSAADDFYLAEVLFDDGAQDISGASYIAIEIRNVKGNPGMTFGVLCGGSRWATYDDSKDAFFVKQDGTVQVLDIQWSSINLGTEPGMLLLPIDSLSEVIWGSGVPLSVARAFFMETNGLYNWDWQVQFGEVGLYTGEIGSGTFKKLTDLSVAKNSAFTTYNTNSSFEFPAPVEPEIPGGPSNTGDTTVIFAMMMLCSAAAAIVVLTKKNYR